MPFLETEVEQVIHRITPRTSESPIILQQKRLFWDTQKSVKGDRKFRVQFFIINSQFVSVSVVKDSLCCI